MLTQDAKARGIHKKSRGKEAQAAKKSYADRQAKEKLLYHAQQNFNATLDRGKSIKELEAEVAALEKKGRIAQ